MGKFYDFNNMKERVPLLDLLQRYGIEMKYKNGRYWGKLREEEKTSSFSPIPGTNRWYDFGTNESGDIFDIVKIRDNVTTDYEAAEIIAEKYGIDGEKSDEWHPLTNAQYRQLGVIPELATLNIGYDLRKHSTAQLHEWNAKYSMTIQELAKKEPKIYNTLIQKISMNNIYKLRNIYYKFISNLKKSQNEVDEAFCIKCAEKTAKEINELICLLERGLQGDYNFNKLRVNNNIKPKGRKEGVVA